MEEEKVTGTQQQNTKFCKYCGQKIDAECVVCPKCGKQVEQLSGPQQIVINNSNDSINTNVNTNVNAARFAVPAKSKMVALLLAIFLGYLGAHRFYTGKIGTGIIWLFTGGLFMVGWIIDTDQPHAETASLRVLALPGDGEGQADLRGGWAALYSLISPSDC